MTKSIETFLRSRGGQMLMSTLLVPLLLAVVGRSASAESAQTVEVRITQKYLVVMCVDGRPVDAGERRLRLAPGKHILAFTMRNSPRPGTTGEPGGAGTAVVTVTLQAGNRYEVETRAPVDTYSRRVWKVGEWRPAVRDRTQEQIVSSDPEWVDSGCED